MLTISRKEVVDIFVTETVRTTVQCWTVGQLRAMDFLCWFVFFGTILEKSLHFFLSCTCTADAVMALSTERQGQEVWLSVCAQKIFHFSLILFWGKFSGTDQRNFSVSFNWYNLFFCFFLHCNIITVELGTWCHYWAVSTPRSEQQSGSSVLYLQVLVLVSVLFSCSVHF